MRRRTITFAATFAVLLAVLPSALAAPTPRFTKERYATFQVQLTSGKVRAVTFNKIAHSVHVTLDSGRLMLAVYPPQSYKALRAQIVAKGVPVTIEHVTKAGTTKTTAKVHHKLRYIAAGLLVVVIIVIALVLGVNRRRPPAVDDSAAGAPAAATEE